MNIKWRGIITGLLVMAAVTIVFLAIYAGIQQSYRQSANDPQIQLTEDIAAALASGKAVYPLIAIMPKVDMSQSLAPFVMVFDFNGTLLQSSGYFASSSVPVPPPGVFDYVKNNGEDRITWQIPSGERYATVVTKWTNPNPSTFNSTPGSGFVLSARSLREVEARESSLTMMLGAAWIATLLIGILIVLVLFVHRNKKIE